jgi:hemerythrin superfamily protein
MKEPVAYQDAVDLLDADHKAVKKMFIDFDALCEDNATAKQKGALAQRICQALTVHASIEEEIFYPQVREVTGDDPMMDEALEEHAAAKQLIAQIEAMKPSNEAFDAMVKQLAKFIDHHVLEERERIFLAARYSAVDLRGMTLPLLKRKKQLTKKVSHGAKEAA